MWYRFPITSEVEDSTSKQKLLTDLTGNKSRLISFGTCPSIFTTSGTNYIKERSRMTGEGRGALSSCTFIIVYQCSHKVAAVKRKEREGSAGDAATCSRCAIRHRCTGLISLARGAAAWLPCAASRESLSRRVCVCISQPLHGEESLTAKKTMDQSENKCVAVSYFLCLCFKTET